MKHISIDSPVAQRLAQVALFERIQKTFNLYPSKMVSDVKEMAQKRNMAPTDVLSQMHQPTQRLFRETLALAVLILKNRPLPTIPAYPRHTLDLVDYFNLHAATFAQEVKAKAELEGYDAAEAVEWLQREHWQVLEWTFAETMRVLMKEEYTFTA